MAISARSHPPPTPNIDGLDAHPSPDEPTRGDPAAPSGTIDGTRPTIENGAISDARRHARRRRAGFTLIVAVSTLALVGSAFAILGGPTGAPAGAPEPDEPVMPAAPVNAATARSRRSLGQDSRRLDLRVRRRTGALPSRLRSHLRTPSQSARPGPRSPRDARAAGPPALPEHHRGAAGGVVRPHPRRISARPVRGVQAQRRRHSRGGRCAGRCGFDPASPPRARAGPPPRRRVATFTDDFVDENGDFIGPDGLHGQPGPGFGCVVLSPAQTRAFWAFMRAPDGSREEDGELLVSDTTFAELHGVAESNLVFLSIPILPHGGWVLWGG